eukprot:11862315-Ditylum_brightwellii.AAC.1
MANNAKYVEQEDGMCHQTAEALANLADVTMSDRVAVANLSESNTDLANKVVTMAKQIKENR